MLTLWVSRERISPCTEFYMTSVSPVNHVGCGDALVFVVSGVIVLPWMTMKIFCCCSSSGWNGVVAEASFDACLGQAGLYRVNGWRYFPEYRF